MDNFSVDFETLQNNIDKKKIYKLSDVQHRLEKVAFDVVRFNDSNDNIDGLWKIEHSDDGDYIVAMYDNMENNEKTSSWDTILDKHANINIFYKNTPITKIATDKLNILSSDVEFMCKYLPASLNSNEKLASALLKDLPLKKRMELVEKHQELKSLLV